MTEEFALHELCGNRATIHGNEGLTGSIGLVMNRLSDQFLTRATFAIDQYTRRRRGNGTDQL
jgi:hypothetical protein